MRKFVLMPALGVAVALAVTACGADPGPACHEAYQHLVAIAKRNHDPAQQSRFVEACTVAWDPARVACLGAASTPSEALACKSKKKRPS